MNKGIYANKFWPLQTDRTFPIKERNSIPPLKISHLNYNKNPINSLLKHTKALSRRKPSERRVFERNQSRNDK